jgi:GTPase SAR1 family protein
MNLNKELKVVLLGDSGKVVKLNDCEGVGKSSILLRFCVNDFKVANEPTLGAAFMSKTIMVDNATFKFQVRLYKLPIDLGYCRIGEVQITYTIVLPRFIILLFYIEMLKWH